MLLDTRITGLAEVRRRLEAIERYPRTMRRALGRLVAKTVKRQTTDRIRYTRTGPDGRRWKPWSASYAATNPRGTILHQTGNLLKSIQSRFSDGLVVVSSSMPYAATHQFGSGRTPARPFFGLSTDGAQELSDTVDRWVRENQPR